MMWVFGTAETIKYKNRELQREAAKSHLSAAATAVIEPAVRREARMDVRLRRQAHHGHN